MRTFDAAVLGLGTMGSFTCLELARRGLSVAGFDQFAPPHTRGSHSGDTRVFREAYAEHPGYVPLAVRAGELWDQYGAEFGSPLLTRCGMLSIGPPEGVLVSGVNLSARLHGLKIENLSWDEIRSRYPGFTPPEDHVATFEPAAGWVDVNRAIGSVLDAARKAKAELFLDTPVTAWHSRNGTIVIETEADRFETARLIVTAGAWADRMLRDLQLPLKVQRKVLVWIDPATPALYAPGRFPVFAIEEHFYYGFPDMGHGVKVAIHWDPGAQVGDPSQPVPPADESDLTPAVEMASRYLPDLVAPPPAGLARVRQTATCLYTMTPDEHFIIDRHPEYDNVCLAAGFSGHGFKFAPSVGETLANLATTGRTDMPIEFLGLQRFR